MLRDGWAEQLSNVELPDGAGGTRPATVDDLNAALGHEVVAPHGPEEVEEVFRVLAGENGVSLDDWEIDEQRLMDSGAPGTRALPVTLLGSTFTRRDALSAVARAFDVTPDEAAALTARFLERDGGRPGPGRPRCRHRAHPDAERSRRPGHERRPALHDHRAPGRRTTHHRFRCRRHRRRNRPGRPQPRSNTSSGCTPTSTASRPTVCGRCSPRATATTW